MWHVQDRQTPLTFPDSSVPAPCHTGWSRTVFLRNPAHSIARIPDQVFRERRIGKGGSWVQPGHEKQGIIRHPCWAKAPPVWQRSVPSPSGARVSARCQGKAHCSPGPREAPGFPAGAILIGRGRSGHASTASPCRELHVSPRCHRAPLSLNPARKSDALFPQG